MSDTSSAPFVAYRREITSGLRADDLLTDVAKASFVEHDGPFGDADVERWSVHLPAVIVGIADVGETSILGPQTIATVTGATTVLAKEKDQALAIAGRVLRAIARDPASGAFRSPTKVRARNFYGPKTVELGVSLWMITWEQDVKIGELADADTLDDFAKLFHEFAMGDDDNTEDLDQLIELETA